MPRKSKTVDPDTFTNLGLHQNGDNSCSALGEADVLSNFIQVKEKHPKDVEPLFEILLYASGLDTIVGMLCRVC